MTPRHVFRLYAHRGATAELPENTVEAFARALEIDGVDAIETDVHLTGDGHVVVSHDETGARMAGVPTPIRQASLAELQGWDVGHGFVDAGGGRPFVGRGYRIPTLEAVLTRFPGVRFNVDLKAPDPHLVTTAIELIRRLGAVERVLLTSTRGSNVRRIKRAGYEGDIGLGAAQVVRLLASPAPLLRLPRLPGGAAQLPVRYGPLELGRPWLLRRCRALGLRIDFWTVDDPDEARRLLALGVDGLMTDDPARIAPVVRAARATRAPAAT